MTQEELDESVSKHVKEQLVPKEPAAKQSFSAADKKYFKSLVQPKHGELLSDYNRQITKSYEKKSNRRCNQVPHLGQQSKQLIPPLKVFFEKDAATAQFVLECGLTKA